MGRMGTGQMGNENGKKTCILFELCACITYFKKLHASGSLKNSKNFEL